MRCGLKGGRVWLHPFLKFFAQEAFRPNQEYENDDKEGKSILEGDGYITTGKAFCNPQNQSSNNGSGQAVQAAQDGSSSGVDADLGDD